MHCVRKINEALYWIGAVDRRLSLFENLFPISKGITYNSYLIKDEKNVLLDTVDYSVGRQFIENLEYLLNGEKLDYLIINHMEPDHCSLIEEIVSKNPEIKIICNMPTTRMLKNFFHFNFDEQIQIVKEGDCLNIGKHEFQFIMAPMVHWPEVMFTYDEKESVLFSADAFGKFGTLDYDDPEGWACEARRYYFGIVGKYGNQVQSVLKKLAGLKVSTICPLHGPILDKDIDYYLGIYNTWSSYEAESKGVFIPTSSVYGNTLEASMLLKEKLEAKGIKAIVCDLNRDSLTEAYEDAFRYDRIVFASVTYNGTMFPSMNVFLEGLVERGYQNKKVGIIENGTWAPMASKAILDKLSKCKNLEILEPIVKLTSKLDSNSIAQIEELANKLA